MNYGKLTSTRRTIRPVTYRQVEKLFDTKMEKLFEKNNKVMFERFDKLDEKIDKEIGDLALITKNGFDAVDIKIDKIDEKLEKRFSNLDTRLIGLSNEMSAFAENYVKKEAVRTN